MPFSDSPSPLRRQTALILLLCIILVGAAVRVFAFHGFAGLDDGEYARLAHEAAVATPHAGSYAGPAVFPLRVGVTLPVAVVFKTFGVSEWSLVLYPFLLSLLAIALAYLCGSLFFDRRAGLIAAALASLMTWQVEAATWLLPDLPGMFFGALGVALIMFGLRRGPRGNLALFGAGCAAGLAFGASWLCKEAILYSVPFCVLLMPLTLKANGPRAVWLWSGVAAGSLLVIGSETAIYWYTTGDALHRFHETERNYTQNAKYFFTEGSRYGWRQGETFGHAVVNRLFVVGPSMVFLNRQALYVPLIALVAAVYALVQRDRSFLIPSLWLWSLALMFNFASSSLAAYRPLVLFHRYLLPVFFAASIVTAGFLAAALWPRLQNRPRRAPRFCKGLGVATAAALLWVGSTEAYFAIKYRPSFWAADVRALTPVVPLPTSVVADTLTLRGLEFFAGYPSTKGWKDFEQLRSADDIPPGAIIIVNDRYINWLEANGGLWGSRDSGYVSRAIYDTPPPSWTRVWQSSNTIVYRSASQAAEPVAARANPGNQHR